MNAALSHGRTGTASHRLLALGVLLATSALCAPAELLAHAHLTRSTPSAGDRLAAPPTAVSLWFSEAPEVAFSTITLLGPGSARVTLGPIERVSGEPLAISAPIGSPLAPGEYTVVWQTAASDGHPSRGRFSFVVLRSSAAPLSPAPPASPPASASQVETMQRRAQGQPRPTGAPGGDEDDVVGGAESPAYVAVRWLMFAALLALVGAMSFRWLVLPAAIRAADGHARGLALRAAHATLLRRAAGLGAIAAVALLVAAVARLHAQAVAMHGAAAGGVSLATMRQIVAQTRWGSEWLAQLAAALVALLALAAALRSAGGEGRGGRAAWAVATAAVLLLAFTPALGGHAAATPRLTMLAVASDGLHVLGAGGWLGSLLVVSTVGLPAVLALDSSERGGAVVDLVNAFSSTALAFATLVVLTGLFAGWLHLGGLSALWDSAYGRTLLIKLGVLAPVLGTGAYNWLRLRPALGHAGAAGRLRRSAVVELAFGGLVLLVTAVLVAVQTPV